MRSKMFQVLTPLTFHNPSHQILDKTLLSLDAVCGVWDTDQCRAEDICHTWFPRRRHQYNNTLTVSWPALGQNAADIGRHWPARSSSSPRARLTHTHTHTHTGCHVQSMSAARYPHSSYCPPGLGLGLNSLLKAKFHYASCFEAGSKLVADQLVAKFHGSMLK